MADTKTTKAPVPAPKRARASFLGGLSEVPTFAPTSVPNNMTETEYANLNFKVDKEFKRVFKLTAATHDISYRDLLEQAFAAWVEKHKAAK
ncbi:hypothetical protein [Phyllobacterium myrsinacearum]|uniref:Uncharacterized protein n=1 Tax=Phyllobacterium myrsinacearum TaxID=28101 RepID=A0A839EZ91_9HYPH|nr:hypothetical protein [Phyllobacterium myrsinacearum]MBA8881697.1 hypothetical protein [Phyllobacterium myrsinacearum]